MKHNHRYYIKIYPGRKLLYDRQALRNLLIQYCFHEGWNYIGVIISSQQVDFFHLTFLLLSLEASQVHQSNAFHRGLSWTFRVEF